MIRNALITTDEQILGGIPVFTGTRVPVKNLFDYLAAGDSLEEFLDDFPGVTRDHALNVLRFAGEILAGEAHADSH